MKKLDIQAPPQWIAEKMGRGYVWTTQVINQKHGCRASEKQLEEIKMYDKLFREMKPEEQEVIRASTRINNLFNRNGEWFKKEVLKRIKL